MLVTLLLFVEVNGCDIHHIFRGIGFVQNVSDELIPITYTWMCLCIGG